MMRICPKCGAYYVDGSSAFCLVDGTPLVNVDPSSDNWSEGVRALEEKDIGLRKQKRKLKWRRVVISTMLIATIVVCAAAFNRWTRVERVPNFKISGQVTEAGKPRGDVKITLYRGREEIRSELTDAQGKYAFTELPAGVSYIISPDPEIRFTEPSHPINSLRQDEAADFFVQLYKISGQVTEAGKPLGNVKITLYRERIEIDSKMTDAQGNYAFTELPGGVGYIITPDKKIRFTEPSHPINSLRQDEAADFSVQLYKISGQVTEAGKPLGNVKITLYRERIEIDSKMTDAQGNYAFTELPGGASYIITPDPKIRFTKPSYPINSLKQDEPADFSVQLYKISGQVTQAGKPRGGVKITLYRGRQEIDSKTTDARGNYTFGDRPAGASYIITPDPNMKFTQSSRTINLAKDEVAVDFSVQLYKITGQVTWKVTEVNYQFNQGMGARQPLAGVKITLNKGTTQVASKTTDARGNYVFSKLPPGDTYTVIAARDGIIFERSSYVVNLTQDAQCDFIATPDRIRRREPERRTAPLTRRPGPFE